MATQALVGTNKTNLGLTPIVKMPVTDNGMERVLKDSVTVAVQADTGSTFQFGPIPKGAKIREVGFAVSGADIANLTAKAGDGTDDDAFGKAVAVTGDKWTKLFDSVGCEIALTAEINITITTAGAAAHIPVARKVLAYCAYTPA